MCAMPKGYLTNINIKTEKIGLERRQEILDGIADKGTFLPKGVMEEDMDETFIDFIQSDKRLSLSIDGEKVPVIFLTIQRWVEFTKSWKFSDEYKNIKLPFITIIRKPDIQQGQNQAGLWNIPGDRTYTYMKVPTWDGVRKGVDLYKVPQPTSVDLTYEVRIFTNKLRHLNRFNNKIQRAFQSRQCYINVNGHPMPLHLETIGDESNIDDFENRRFYAQMYEMKLLGYILNEEDYEVIPTINRTIVSVEVDEDKFITDIVFEPKKKANVATYSFIFKPKTSTEFSFTAKYGVSFSRLVDIVDITRIIIYVNGVGVFDGTILMTPIIINPNDIVMIKINKNFLATGMFKLIGNII
jgi:hypothetical protein